MPNRFSDSDCAWRDWPWWQLHRSLPPAALQPWLRETGSLTDRLRQYSRGPVRVRVLRQRIARPRLDELQALECKPCAFGLIREVLLYAADEPAFFGRTVIPVSDLRGRLAHLRRWGSQSIGSYLFDQPTLQRGELQFCHCRPDRTGIRETASLQAPLWGRRSRFGLYRGRILVSEFFLPAFPTRSARYE